MANNNNENKDQTVRLRANMFETEDGIPFSAINPKIGEKAQAFHELAEAVLHNDEKAAEFIAANVFQNFDHEINRHLNEEDSVNRICEYLLPDQPNKATIVTSSDLQAAGSWFRSPETPAETDSEIEADIVKYAAAMIDSCYRDLQIKQETYYNKRFSIARDFSMDSHPDLAAAGKKYPFIGCTKYGGHIVYGTTKELRLVIGEKNRITKSYTTDGGHTAEMSHVILTLYPNADSNTAEICRRTDLEAMVRKTPAYKREKNPLFKAALCAAATPLRPGEKDTDVKITLNSTDSGETRVTFSPRNSKDAFKFVIIQNVKDGELSIAIVINSRLINEVDDKAMDRFFACSKDMQEMYIAFKRAYETEQAKSRLVTRQAQKSNAELLNAIMPGTGGIARSLILRSHQVTPLKTEIKHTARKLARSTGEDVPKANPQPKKIKQPVKEPDKEQSVQQNKPHKRDRSLSI